VTGLDLSGGGLDRGDATETGAASLRHRP
jgi:hypothetical protein